MTISNKDLVTKYFVKQANGDWKCRCGKARKMGNGWNNLLDHINRDHSDSVQEARSSANSTVSSFFRKKETNLFNWIQWVVEDLLPFSFCENSNTRKFTKLEPVTVKTLKLNMSHLSELVRNKIRNLLPSQFAIVFDGWTDCSTHFLAVFAVFPDKDQQTGYNKALLSFFPLADETSLDADSHHESIYDVLQQFGKDFSNIACIIGDNCALNKSLAKKCKSYLVGCASHRLNLGVQKFLSYYSDLIDSVRAIMVSLRKIKNRAALKELTPLSPVLDNATRWSSKYQMLSRYSEILQFVESIVPRKLQLSPGDNDKIEKLLKKLSQLEILTKFLQSEERNLYEVREAFDQTIKLFECLSDHCSAKASIVCDPIFESAICKIQEHQVFNESLQLTPAESRCVQHLKAPVDVIAVDASNEGCSESECDEMESILQNVKRAKIERASRYIDCRFIRPTSNMCERLFSLSKLALSDQRKSLLPENVEMQLFLKLNNHLWDMDLFQSELLQPTDLS
ncbi:Tam3-transposase (Ac family) [Plasmopara halstedii]|uniref:Tam3-transposase (Ac family) n=1 Tax=Plasmopara halstedii TaxID=4781 RepID=A0A0N7L3L9_PLAHL|nr:Tam3-transposase (Ac family) [Plasmopara halstedii]CEG36243.1 Tam3-transposase (Ac family) [Plasmopara halstedii]|eukprot:XP_024572612.1 Tam3-transposase (Ac family) [Plasmopara halstedii]